MRLLVWGWLISLFLLPETIASLLFPKEKWKNHREAYRILCGIGAVGNILIMIVANLIGFAVGLDGLKGLVQGVVGSNSGKLSATRESLENLALILYLQVYCSSAALAWHFSVVRR